MKKLIWDNGYEFNMTFADLATHTTSELKDIEDFLWRIRRDIQTIIEYRKCYEANAIKANKRLAE